MKRSPARGNCSGALPLAGLLVAFASLPACSDDAGQRSIDEFLPYVPLTQHVDPLIGTRSSGNVIPGAQVPHGMVKLSPDTLGNAARDDGYEYNDAKIEGFSHTHLEGTGGDYYGYSQLLVMPTRGDIATKEAAYASAYAHEAEDAEPGYYKVDLSDHHVRAELTATARCGVHRYTFEGAEPGNVLIDLAHSRGGWVSGSIAISGDHVIEGEATYNVHPTVALVVTGLQRDIGTTARRKLYFHAEFNRPFDSFGTWSGDSVNRGGTSAGTGTVGAFAGFGLTSTPVEVRVCLSSIDGDHARRAFQLEAAPDSFDVTRAKAKEAWNKLLNRIQVEGGGTDDLTTFYSALYRSSFQPVDYTEDGSYWNGDDGAGTVSKASGWRYYSDDWCMWDTFRTTHPLGNLIEPERSADEVRSMLVGYDQAGWLSKCTWQATGNSRVMIANPFTPIMVDAYVKGLRGFDADKAYEALRKSAMEDVPETVVPGICGYFNLGTPPEYVEKGWVSHECDGTQSASMTLEYAHDDWALSKLAAALGKKEDAPLFAARAKNYRNVFNAAHGMMQGRRGDGTFVEPFDPAGTADFTEATSWIYTWSVPHDVAGLIGLMGGKDSLVAKLDEYFEGGHHDMSNEPAFHTPYLYLYAGQPAKTQARVRQLMQRYFNPGPEGIPGNDDAGAMSSWYVLSAIGLYPVSPGDTTYLIGSPIFPKATIYLEPNHYAGQKFTIEAEGTSAENLYVQSATLDGQPYEKPWITHEAIVKGGTLKLVMGAAPSTWGSAPENAPPSMP